MISLPIRRVSLKPPPLVIAKTPTWMILPYSLSLMLTRVAIASLRTSKKIIVYYGNWIPHPRETLVNPATQSIVLDCENSPKPCVC
jgi:hypothetical protein